MMMKKMLLRGNKQKMIMIVIIIIITIILIMTMMMMMMTMISQAPDAYERETGVKPKETRKYVMKSLKDLQMVRPIAPRIPC